MERSIKKARREKVLDIIVKFHIDSAEPVGSKTVSDYMELSSATIRNIMSELEAMGLIGQPYTSAGRIPTEEGYRFYVDFLMQPQEVLPEEKQGIESIYKLESNRLDDIMEKGLHILSSMSSLASLVMFPRINENRLYYDGTHYILEQPEFRNTDTIKLLFKALEEKKALLNLFAEDLDLSGDRIKIRIGSENKDEGLKQCSLITASFKIGGTSLGTVGILGPKRMKYSKLISRVNYFARTISRFLDEREKT